MKNEPLLLAYRFLLAALATWRLAFLIVREDGPGRIFARWRTLISRGVPAAPIDCVKCTGLWVAIPLAFFVGGGWIELVVIWLALGGIVALIDEATRPPFEWREGGNDELLRPGPDDPAQ